MARHTVLNAGDFRMASVYPSLTVLPLQRGREDICGNQQLQPME